MVLVVLVGCTLAARWCAHSLTHSSLPPGESPFLSLFRVEVGKCEHVNLTIRCSCGWFCKTSENQSRKIGARLNVQIEHSVVAEMCADNTILVGSRRMLWTGINSAGCFTEEKRESNCRYEWGRSFQKQQDLHSSSNAASEVIQHCCYIVETEGLHCWENRKISSTSRTTARNVVKPCPALTR